MDGEWGRRKYRGLSDIYPTLPELQSLCSIHKKEAGNMTVGLTQGEEGMQGMWGKWGLSGGCAWSRHARQ